jgi:hypothetical protein
LQSELALASAVVAARRQVEIQSSAFSRVMPTQEAQAASTARQVERATVASDPPPVSLVPSTARCLAAQSSQSDLALVVGTAQSSSETLSSVFALAQLAEQARTVSTAAQVELAGTLSAQPVVACEAAAR